MQRFTKDPREHAFVQDPYPLYAQMRAAGDLVWWEAFDMPFAVSHHAVSALLRDRRFGREIPPEFREETPMHLQDWQDVEQHSLLELEPPRHTTLRGLVLRAFTSRRVRALAPEIDALAATLIADFPSEPFDLLAHFCTPLPVRIIARLLGVPEESAPDLLRWSHAMVAMYQTGRTRATEEAANKAAQEFAGFLTEHITAKRHAPADDLISHLLAAEADGNRLSRAELISTCILLLNAGHEATVHTLGNGVRLLLQNGLRATAANAETLTEEILRFDPPLHVFQRIAYEEVTLFGHRFQRGDRVALLLASANRDPQVFTDPDRFDPNRAPGPHQSFGAGIHFCLGAPLARLEMRCALPRLFADAPHLRLAKSPHFADTYHFHGLSDLTVATS